MKKKGIILCLGLLIAFTMVASDLALAAEPKEIVIGSTLALSGRFKGIVGEFDKLVNAWTDLVNERGGIYVKEYGKKLPIRFVIYDDASKPRLFHGTLFQSYLQCGDHCGGQTQDPHGPGLCKRSRPI
jgi:hypothetical protein